MPWLQRYIQASVNVLTFAMITNKQNENAVFPDLVSKTFLFAISGALNQNFNYIAPPEKHQTSVIR